MFVLGDNTPIPQWLQKWGALDTNSNTEYSLEIQKLGSIKYLLIQKLWDCEYNDQFHYKPF